MSGMAIRTPSGRPAEHYLIGSGVPTGINRLSLRMLPFGTRTQPCDGRPGISSGWFVPWMPTTPPPGQSVSESE